MSGSVSLEYGFPSTHSANAVSVVVYAVLCLRSPESALEHSAKLALEGLSYFYAVSIVFGRLYCGMHGFLDVIIGSVLGAVISLIEFFYAPAVEMFVRDSDFMGIALLVLSVIVLVRIHPEPADDCPCFDDSLAFAGVVIGVEIAHWSLERSRFAGIPFEPSVLGWPAVIARVIFGILCIFAWREVAKPTLLKSLPHLFRFIERLGLILPRRFFMSASEYQNIPARLKVDNVIPTASDVAGFMTSIRHPTRGRSISIGPQSAADAYETLAYRERRRRESAESVASLRSKNSIQELLSEERSGGGGARSSGAVYDQTGRRAAPGDFEKQMGQGTVIIDQELSGEPEVLMEREEENGLGEKEVFAKLVKPRVRYDVEVVAKLVVYAGIGFLAVNAVPIMFELIPGLGMGHV